MYGLKDLAGKVTIKGRGIFLTNDSSQGQFERAIKQIPQLKGDQIIELNATQIKEREAKKQAKQAAKGSKVSNLKTSKNGKEKETESN